MPDATPYVGPRAFLPGETLYGRDREIADLRDLLIAERAVLFYAPSGAGKTSLLQAGLRDALIRKEFAVLPVARVSDPAGLAAANRYVGGIVAGLGNDSGLTLDQAMEGHLASGKRTVLIVDQFEELYTLDAAGEGDRDAFFESLADVMVKYPRLWLLIAMREDYLAMLDRHRDWLPTRLRCHYRLDLLGPEAARRAIRLPAESRGVDFTEAAAVSLVDDLRALAPKPGEAKRLGPFVEPLHLQIACLRIWERCSKDGGPPERIDIDEVGGEGGIDQALADYYDDKVGNAAAASATASGADPVVAERELREWVQKKLIVPPGIRAQVPSGEQGQGALPPERIEPLRDAYLVRLDERHGEEWYELSHDRLIPPIQASNKLWLEQNLHSFQNLAALWSARPLSEYLLLDAALGEASKWSEEHPARITAVERDFLAACQAEEKRLKEQVASAEQLLQKNRILIFVGIASIFALAYVAVSLVSYYKINNKLKYANQQIEDAGVLLNNAKDESSSLRNISAMERAEAERQVAVLKHDSALSIAALKKQADLDRRMAKALLADAINGQRMATKNEAIASEKLVVANRKFAEAETVRVRNEETIKILNDEKTTIIGERAQLAEKVAKNDIVLESLRRAVRDAPDSALTRTLAAQLSSTTTTSEEVRKDQRIAAGLDSVTQEKAPATSVRAKLWKPGATLQVRFLNGNPAQRAVAMAAAAEWSRYANLKFAECSTCEAEMRIEFGQGSWSYIGTDALGVRSSMPTMTLPDWNGSGRPPDMRYALHEFGHALGLIHENNNPNGTIPWDTDAVKSYYRGAGFTDQLISTNILQKAPISDYRPLDLKSIMWYGDFPSKLFKPPLEVGGNVLSPGDKAFIAKLYPKTP